MSQRRYQVFISSTYKDLIDEREAVIKAILQNYHFPIGMEMFHADDQEQWIQIAQTIDMSDFYVLILGNCCGTLMKTEDKSYTEKEYDYAMQKGIPVLAFIINPKTTKEHFEETARQRKVYKRFKEKVELLPRMIWDNKDDLAMKVITTLHAKIAENKRRGWVPYNPAGIYSGQKINPDIAGEYKVIHYAAFSTEKERVIYSKLVIDTYGNITFMNNLVYKGGTEAEFSYHGICEDTGSLIYIHLKNDHSNERITMLLINPVGRLERFIGLLSGVSSNNFPVCVKIACLKEKIEEKVNMEALTNILKEKNITFHDNAMVIEDNARMLFFSDHLLK